MMTDQAPHSQQALDDTLDFEDVDLFADTVEERLNAGSESTFGSGSSFSCAGGTFCSFGTISSACTASVIV
jgi:hypothetical protein